MIYNSTYSEVYDRTYALFRDQQAESELIAEVARELLQAGETILDLGCGTGIHLSILDQALRGQMTLAGIDGSEFMIERSRERLGDSATIYLARLDNTWPIHSESIGLVYGTFNIFQSFLDAGARYFFMSEAARVLRAGGVAILDSHCEPSFGVSHPSGSVSTLDRGGTHIEISSLWSSQDSTKTTSIRFTDKASGDLILDGQHTMVRITWPDIQSEFARAGFVLRKAFSDWKKSFFDPQRSPAVVLTLEKG